MRKFVGFLTKIDDFDGDCFILDFGAGFDTNSITTGEKNTKGLEKKINDFKIGAVYILQYEISCRFVIRIIHLKSQKIIWEKKRDV